MNWKFFVRMCLPLLRQAGESKKAEDENTTGKDDMIGTSLVYAADLLDAILADKPKMPKVPEALK
jgi:hypothetical protein